MTGGSGTDHTTIPDRRSPTAWSRCGLTCGGRSTGVRRAPSRSSACARDRVVISYPSSASIVGATMWTLGWSSWIPATSKRPSRVPLDSLSESRSCRADAGRTDAYVDAVPAQIVLACGLFGNISEEDIQRTVLSLPMLCARGATVIWTRHRRPPDLTPVIRAWFSDSRLRRGGVRDARRHDLREWASRGSMLRRWLSTRVAGCSRSSDTKAWPVESSSRAAEANFSALAMAVRWPSLTLPGRARSV